MKYIFLCLFLIPFFAHSQCPTFIGGSVDSLQRAVPFLAHLSVYSETDKIIEWRGGDLSDRKVVKIALDESKRIRYLEVTGTKPFMDSLLNNCYLPQLQGCITKQSDAWVFTDKVKLIYSQLPLKASVNSRLIIEPNR
jgi:hypothetical protein